MPHNSSSFLLEVISNNQKPVESSQTTPVPTNIPMTPCDDFQSLNTAMECLASLFQYFGRYIGQLINETCELLFKLSSINNQKSVITRTTATYTLSRAFQGVPGKNYQLKLSQTSLKQLRNILEKDKSQTVKQHAAKALLHLIQLNTHMDYLLIIPDIEYSYLSWLTICMNSSSNSIYQLNLGQLFGGILVTSQIQAQKLKITKGTRLTYDKCLEYLFLLASKGTLTKSTGLLKSAIFSNAKDSSIGIKCGLHAVAYFINTMSVDHLESHLRYFIKSIIENCTNFNSFKFIIRLVVSLLPEKSLASNMMKRVKNQLSEVLKNLDTSKNLDSKQIQTSDFAYKTKCLLFTIQEIVLKLKSSSAACLESNQVLSTILESKFTNSIDVSDQKAATLKAISTASPQLTNLIIEACVKNLIKFMDEDVTDLEIRTSAKIILQCMQFISEVELNPENTSKFVGIPFEQPKEIFTYGEMFLTSCESPVMIEAGWLLIHAAMMLEQKSLEPRLILLWKGVAASSSLIPNDTKNLQKVAQLQMDNTIEKILVNSIGALESMLLMNKFFEGVIVLSFRLHEIIPNEKLKKTLLKSLVKFGHKLKPHLPKQISLAKTEMREADPCEESIIVLRDCWLSLDDDEKSELVNSFKEVIQSKQCTSQFSSQVIKFFAGIYKTGVLKSQLVADIIYCVFGGLAADNQDVYKPACQAITNCVNWSEGGAQVGDRIYKLTLDE